MSHFSCLLLNKEFACAYTRKSRAFTEGFWYFALTILIYLAFAWRSVLQKKKKKKKKKFFWLNNCFSNLAILSGLCTYIILPGGGVSDKHCLLSFFHFVGFVMSWLIFQSFSFSKITRTDGNEAQLALHSAYRDIEIHEMFILTRRCTFKQTVEASFKEVHFSCFMYGWQNFLFAWASIDTGC